MELTIYKAAKIEVTTVEGNDRRAGWLDISITDSAGVRINITIFAEMLGETPKLEVAPQ